MNNLNQHLEYLLRHNDCVIVPGFGAFVAVMQPAVFDTNTGLYMPPMRSIMFNASISSDDGLLANSYARRLGKKYTSAHTALQRDLELLIQSLNNTGWYSIGNIGTLIRNEDGLLSFRPKFTAQQAMQQIGCTPVAKSAPIQSIQIKAPEDNVSRVSGFNLDKYYYIPINKTFAKSAASVIAVIAVALAAFFYPYSHHKSQVEASVLPIEKVLRLHSFSSKGNTSQKHEIAKMHEVAQNNASTAVEKVSDPVSSLEICNNMTDGEHYNIVVGAFYTKEEADRFAISKSKADDTLSVHSRGRHFLVVCASSDDRKKIVDLLNSKSINNQYPGAWIWEKQKKN